MPPGLRCLIRPTKYTGKQELPKANIKENKQLFDVVIVAVGIKEPSMFRFKKKEPSMYCVKLILTKTWPVSASLMGMYRRVGNFPEGSKYLRQLPGVDV